MTEYAYLVVERADRDVVVYPDGSTSDHARGDGAAVVETWIRARDAEGEKPLADTSPMADPQLTQGREYEAWEARLKHHLRETVWHIRDSAERDSRYEAERLAFLARDPEPVHDRTRSDGSPSDRPKPALREEGFWQARLLSSSTHGPTVLGPGDQPLPRTAIADLLTALATEGWRVVQVSEQRAVEHREARSILVVDGVTFLMTNDAAAAGLNSVTSGSG
jgi:hypothetical protein